MKFLPFCTRREWRTIMLAAIVLSGGMAQLRARPEPPAADRLMDPTKPENQNAGHLFFHGDDNSTPAPPTADEQAFKDFKNGPATFEEFCQQNPLVGKPPGQDRMVIEVLAAEVDAATPSPAEPTITMVEAGNLLRQRLFANSQVQTENVLMLDRQSDGSKMPTPAWEGERLFTCLEQTDAGYTLAFTLAKSQVVNWADGKPVLSQREMNNKLAISADGKWVALDGPMQDASKDRLVVYVRLLKE